MHHHRVINASSIYQQLCVIAWGHMTQQASEEILEIPNRLSMAMRLHKDTQHKSSNSSEKGLAVPFHIIICNNIAQSQSIPDKFKRMAWQYLAASAAALLTYFVRYLPPALPCDDSAASRNTVPFWSNCLGCTVVVIQGLLPIPPFFMLCSGRKPGP